MKTTTSIGIEKDFGVYTPLIPIGAELPFSREVTLLTASGNQGDVAVNIRQGERLKASENSLLGTLVLPDIERAGRSVVKLTLRLTVESDGVQAVLTEKKTGQSSSDEFALFLISLSSEENPYGEVMLDDTGRRLSLDRGLLDTLEPAYCITLHKAQGSQFRRVIVCLNNSHLIDRTWLYTAITRTEIELHIIGNQQSFGKIIKDGSRHYKRQTGLRKLLQGN